MILTKLSAIGDKTAANRNNIRFVILMLRIYFEDIKCNDNVIEWQKDNIFKSW